MIENRQNHHPNLEESYDYEDTEYNAQTEVRHGKKSKLIALGAIAAATIGFNQQKIVDTTKEIGTNAAINIQEVINPQTLDLKETEAPVSATSINGLDQTEIDFNNYELISADQPYTVTIEKDQAVRTTDRDYIEQNTLIPETTNHTAIIVAKEDVQFTLSEVYQHKETGKLVAPVEDFLETADEDPQPTGLKDDIDEDGWVAIDATAKNLDSPLEQ